MSLKTFEKKKKTLTHNLHEHCGRGFEKRFERVVCSVQVNTNLTN